MTRIEKFKQIKVDELISQGIETKDLRELVREGARLLNPKVNSLLRAGAEQKKIAQDAYMYLEQTGGKFNLVSKRPGKIEKDRNELLHELKREIEYANMKTSTVTGAREVQKQRESIVRDQYTDSEWNKLTQEQKNQIVSDTWDEFHTVQETQPVPPSKDLVRIFKTANGDPEELDRLIKEYKKNDRANFEKALKESAERTAYRPKWNTNPRA